MSGPLDDLKDINSASHRCLGMGEHAENSRNVWIYLKDLLEQT